VPPRSPAIRPAIRHAIPFALLGLIALAPVARAAPPDGDGVLRVELREALVRGDDAAKAARPALELELTRADGQWLPTAWGVALRYNQADHDLKLTAEPASPVDADTITFEVEGPIRKDPWVPGGWAKYTVTLKRADGGWVGTYNGRFGDKAVEGEAAGTFIAWPAGGLLRPAVEPGEHPRLLWTADELPTVRQRAQTPAGRAIVAAIERQVASVPEDKKAERHSRVNRMIGHATLYSLTGEGGHGDAAIALMQQVLDNPPGAHAHDVPRLVQDIALAYDLIYDRFTDAQRDRVTTWLRQISVPIALEGVNNISPNSNWTAIMQGGVGVGLLAVLGEPGPFDLPAPQAPAAVVEATPLEGDPAGDGPPVNPLKPGELIRDWLMLGPVQPKDADTPVIADHAAPAAVRLTTGDTLDLAGRTLTVRGLPAELIKPGNVLTPDPGIALRGTPPGMVTYLYSELRVAEAFSGRLRLDYALGYEGGRAWVGGRAVDPGGVVTFEPGRYPVLVEARGQGVAPRFEPADAEAAAALGTEHAHDLAQYQAAKAAHAATGMHPGVERAYPVWKRKMDRWFRYALGDHGWKTETEGYQSISLDMALPAAACFDHLHRRSVAPQTGLRHVLAMNLLRRGGGGYSGKRALFSHTFNAYAMHLADPAYAPAMRWLVAHEMAPAGFEQLDTEALAYALAFAPLTDDAAPAAHPQAVMPKAMADTRKGAYVFRNGYDFGDPPAGTKPGNIVAQAFFRSDKPYPAYYHVQAGSFRLDGFGTPWAVGRDSDKRDWQYAAENVVLVGDSNGHGLGRVTYHACDDDGSGVVGADMADVYNARTGLDLAASRHLAVDFRPAGGADAVLVVADRIEGGPRKTWQMHTHTRAVDTAVDPDGRGFTLTDKAGHTLRGHLIAPADARFTGGGTLRITTDAESADFLVVMTLQRGDPPDVTAEKRGDGWTVAVGERRFAFDGERLSRDRDGAASAP